MVFNNGISSVILSVSLIVICNVFEACASRDERALAKCAYGLGWMEFKNKCYIKSSAMASWYAAKTSCYRIDADFVYIDNEEENEWLASQCAEGSPSRFGYCWLGADDSLGNGDDFRWVYNDQAVGYNNWYPGEPKNAMLERCVIMAHGVDAGTWENTDCNSEHFFFCKKNPKT